MQREFTGRGYRAWLSYHLALIVTAGLSLSAHAQNGSNKPIERPAISVPELLW